MKEQHNKPNVGIIPHMFLERVSQFHLSELIALVRPLANRLFVITDVYDNTTYGVQIVPIKAKKRASFLSKVREQIIIHVQVMRALASLRKEIDILIFFLGGIEFAIPLVFAKCLKISCFAVLTGLGNAKRIRPVKESGASWHVGELLRLYITATLERLTCFFSDKLIVYDESLVDQGRLHKYRKKIVVTHRHFIDFSKYQLKDDITQRDNVVSYVGRLHEEKGVLNLVKAIPKVLSQRADVRFVLIGDGHLEGEIRSYVQAHALHHNVVLAGWVPHQELPAYLTASKLLVLPSYTEGLPHAMLEAMACGTPVLATPVGAIPQLVTDKETGFLMHDNSSSCLADNIVDVLTYPHLRRIILNARTLVQKEFRYENVLEMWRDVICDGRKSKLSDI